jgi:hypothetical protein
MALGSSDKNERVANKLDQISGQVAALVAYVSATCPSLKTGDEVGQVMDIAKSLCTHPLGSPTRDEPKTVASSTVVQIHEAARNREKAHKAG